MKTTINVEDPAEGHAIGRDASAMDAFSEAMKLQRQHNRFAASAKLPRIPKGVVKFQTHEEADEWLMKVWTRTLEKRPAATRKHTT